MIKKLLMAGVLALAGAGAAQAQYWSIANQASNMIQNAVIGGFNYKGYVDASYLAGMGTNKVNFLNFTTSQGFTYGSWFFMGAGLGVDVAFSQISDPYQGYRGATTTKTGVMIPIFTDFRFMIGQPTSVGFNIGVKIGGSFLVSNNYLETQSGYIANKEYFYLAPSLGVRVPISTSNSKQALNAGVMYQLVTSNNFCYWYGNGSNVTLNGLGVYLGFEW